MVTRNPDTLSIEPERMQHIAWLSMAFSVPVNWEIIRHAVSWNNGRLVFVDKRHQRLSVGWTACTRRPDTRKMMEDCLSRDKSKFAGSAFEAIPKVRQWSGYRWNDTKLVVTRAGCYDQVHDRWIETVFTRPGECDHELEKRILESFSFEKKNERRWRAFGIDVTSPAGWTLEKADVFPGECSFTFATTHGSAVIRKLKNPEDWLGDALDVYLRKQAGGRNVVVESTSYNGHDAFAADTRETEPHLRWVIGDRRYKRDIVWNCPSSHALFLMTTVVQKPARVGNDGEEQDSVITVRCCNDKA